MKILNIDYLKLIVILDNQGTCVGFVINKIESFIVSIKDFLYLVRYTRK